nr:MBL fold metallo-hydrolase [Oceanicola sp. 502str15]
MPDNWGDCDPTNPRNARRRCSMLVERDGPEGTTRVLIDTSPDLRSQLLDAKVGTLDGVAFTHAHADHTHGLDDLRMVVYNMRNRVKVWADGATTDDLIARFGYAFVQPAGSDYPPILDLHHIDGPFTVEGAGGPITLTPFEVEHGRIDALGFRIEGLAYLPDVSDIPEAAWPALEGLEVWVLDALRRTPHPSHVHLEKALEWIERAAPRQAVLTNMHIDMDYAAVEAETPANVTPAHDGMILILPS